MKHDSLSLNIQSYFVTPQAWPTVSFAYTNFFARPLLISNRNTQPSLGRIFTMLLMSTISWWCFNWQAPKCFDMQWWRGAWVWRICSAVLTWGTVSSVKLQAVIALHAMEAALMLWYFTSPSSTCFLYRRHSFSSGKQAEDAHSCSALIPESLFLKRSMNSSKISSFSGQSSHPTFHGVLNGWLLFPSVAEGIWLLRILLFSHFCMSDQTCLLWRPISFHCCFRVSNLASRHPIARCLDM